jgi:HEAT repeat protein
MNIDERAEKLAELDAVRGSHVGAATRVGELLRDTDSTVRLRATEVARLFARCSTVVDRLLTQADNEPDSRVVEATIKSLGQVILEGDLATVRGAGQDSLGFPRQSDYERVRSHLYKHLEGCPNPSPLRRTLAFALAPLSGELRCDALIDALWSSTEIADQRAALRAMARSGHGRWSEQVLEAAEHKDLRLRLPAIEAIGELGLEDADDQLALLAHHGLTRERRSAIAALGALATDTALEVLRKLQDDRAASDELGTREALTAAITTRSLRENNSASA